MATVFITRQACEKSLTETGSESDKEETVLESEVIMMRGGDWEELLCENMTELSHQKAQRKPTRLKQGDSDDGESRRRLRALKPNDLDGFMESRKEKWEGQMNERKPEPQIKTVDVWFESLTGEDQE